MEARASREALRSRYKIFISTYEKQFKKYLSLEEQVQFPYSQ
jgi:hypothetical protein